MGIIIRIFTYRITILLFESGEYVNVTLLSPLENNTETFILTIDKSPGLSFKYLYYFELLWSLSLSNKFSFIYTSSSFGISSSIPSPSRNALQS